MPRLASSGAGGTIAVSRTVKVGAHMPEWYGAIADGSLHPLSQRYATLAAAQVDYPFATALTQQIDWCATKAAIDASRANRSAVQTGSAICLGPGTFRFDAEAPLTGTDVSMFGSGITVTCIQATSDLGKGRALIAPDAEKGPASTIAYLELVSSNPNSSALGTAPVAMTGLRLPGGGWDAHHVKAKYFWAGIDMCSDHSGLSYCDGESCGYGLYLGQDRNAEADQSVHGCDFSNNFIASIGIKGSNVMGGMTFTSTHLGWGPYGILKEDSTTLATAPSVTPIGTGATGAPMTGGGTFYYAVAALFGSLSEDLASTMSSSAVVSAGGSVNLTWAAVTGATGYRVYRSTSASPAGTAFLDYYDVGAVTAWSDTGAAVSGNTVRLVGNNLAISGCTFVDVPCEAYGNGVIYVDNGTDMVLGNDFRGMATAQPFTSTYDWSARPQRAVVTCGTFEQNVISGPSAGVFENVGPDADGCTILAVDGSNNIIDVPVYTVPAKPIWTSLTGSVGPGLTVRTSRAHGKLVALNSGSVTAGDLVEMQLSNDRCRRYPAGATTPAHGVAAQTWSTLTAGQQWFLMWEPGSRVDIACTDGTAGANSFLKPDPANAGKVVATTDRTVAVGYAYAGINASKIDTVFMGG